ncbi:hypothetical protein ACJRO7_015176 [Eucalyptus globulus]|uniref:Peptidase M48 domain-containing protein n=1 Tax=Eucalyptus globulus TaxID=34317 RepID=A0ABD3L6K0_EUCGL
MDCPDLSPASLPGGQMAVSAESLDFCKTDAETASIAAQEVGHTMARHGEEMFVQDISLAIRYIHIVELPWWLGFLNSLLPKVKMIMEDHRLEVGLPLPPPYVMLGVFGVLGVLGVFATS